MKMIAKILGSIIGAILYPFFWLLITERRCEMCKTYCPCADCEMFLENGEKIAKFPLCQGCIEEMRETYKDVINTKPKRG